MKMIRSAITPQILGGLLMRKTKGQWIDIATMTYNFQKKLKLKLNPARLLVWCRFKVKDWVCKLNHGGNRVCSRISLISKVEANQMKTSVVKASRVSKIFCQVKSNLIESKGLKLPASLNFRLDQVTTV